MNSNTSPNPTWQDYHEAFLAIKNNLTEKQFEMLRVHYLSPGQEAFPSELGKAVNYTIDVVNLWYGKIGTMLSSKLGISREMPSAILVSYLDQHQANNKWLWKMNPEVTKALSKLKWFD